MVDNFKINGQDMNNALQSPIKGFHAFTKSDTVDETLLVRGFHVNASGDIKCLLEDDTVSRVIYVSAGVYYPYRVKRLYVTDTTATIMGIL